MKFKKGRNVLLFLALLSIGMNGKALADGAAPENNLQMTVGVRAWVNNWTSWSVVTLGGKQTVVPVSSTSEVSLIPVANFRYRNYFGSVSLLANTSYSLVGVSTSSDATRSEFDANAGYYVLPGVGVSLGLKKLKQDFGGSVYQWTGPTLGISASAQLSGPLAMYSSFGIGEFNVSVPAIDQNSGLKADYTVGEFGFAYSLGKGIGFKSTAITIGYRSQSVNTKHYVLPNTLGASYVDVHDMTQGTTFGVVGRF